MFCREAGGAFRHRLKTLKAVTDLVMKERTSYLAKFPQLGRRADLNVTPPETATNSGIEVHEQEWGKVTAQRVYKMRCECGRSMVRARAPEVRGVPRLP